MMSKKKNPQLPKVPLTDLDTHIGITDLDQIYGAQPRQARGELDPFAELERQETMDAVQELRDLQKQKKMLEYKKRLARLKEEVGAEDTLDGGLSVKGLFNFSNADLQGISQMQPAERQAFLDTVKEVSMMSAMVPRGGKTSPIMQLAAMGGFSGGRQQGLSLKDMMEFQQMMNQTYQQAGNRDGGRDLTMKLLTETLPSWQNQAMSNMQLAYQAQINALKDQQSDPVRDIKYIKDAAGMLGMSPGGADREVELARLQMEDRWKLEEFKMRREELQNSKMLGTIKQILENVDVPSMVRAATRQQVGDQLRQPAPPMQTSALPVEQAGVGPTQLVKYSCPNPQCKGADGKPTEIYAPAGQAQVTCQNCGGVYNVKPGSVHQQ